MKPEDKELLLKDLCARLPYGVFMGNKEWNRKPYQLTCDEIQYMMMSDDYEDVPYLRPMSSMTEEEKDYVVKHSLGYTANIGGGKKDEKLYFHFKAESFDWLNKKMFDFRGLIPKGLALSTDEFNPYKDKD